MKDRRENLNEKIMEAQYELETTLDLWAGCLLEFEIKLEELNLPQGQYTDDSVMDACIIFKHILFNVGIYKGLVTEKNAAKFGEDIHKMIKKYTGVDTKTFYTNPEENEEES